MALAETIVLFTGIYFAIGAVVSIGFLTFGAARLDASAAGSGLLFRITAFPGCAVLWPYIVLRWLSGRKINQPIEAEKDSGE